VDECGLDSSRSRKGTVLRHLFYLTTILTSVLEICLSNLSRYTDFADSPKSLWDGTTNCVTTAS